MRLEIFYVNFYPIPSLLFVIFWWAFMSKNLGFNHTWKIKKVQNAHSFKSEQKSIGLTQKAKKGTHFYIKVYIADSKMAITQCINKFYLTVTCFCH